MDSPKKNTFLVWAPIVISLIGVSIATCALVRQIEREAALDEINLTVQSIQQVDPPERTFGYKPFRFPQNRTVNLVLHVGNLGRSPVFIREVRMVFNHRTESTYRPRDRVAFGFTPHDQSGAALDPRQSTYFYLPFDKDLMDYAMEGAGPFPSTEYDYIVEILGPSGTLWTGRPDFDSDLHEASIGLATQEMYGSKSAQGEADMKQTSASPSP